MDRITRIREGIVMMGRYDKEIADLNSRVTIAENKIDSISNLQEQTHSLVQTVQDMASTMKHMLEEQKDMKQDIKALKEEPGKDYKENAKAFKNAIFGAFGTLVGGGIIWMLVQYSNAIAR